MDLEKETRNLVIAILFIVLPCVFVTLIPYASAHQSGCHRWHSCPSDTGSYECGDTGYCSQCPDNIYCKAGQPISFSSSTSSSSNAPSSGSSSSTPPSTPEFGSISALVLTLAITSIILIRYKNNHKNHI